MRTAVYSRVLCICMLLALNSCKHKKSAVSTPKNKKKQVVAKANPQKAAPSAKPPAGPYSKEFEQKLGLSDKDINNNKLFLFINDWYGTPYKYGGCQKTGIDCSCFTNLLYDKVYNKKTGRSADDMYNACDKLLLSEVREGDLLFFKINGHLVSHVGVYLRNNLFVHASTSKGIIINSVDEAYYKKYFHSGGRLKNS